MGHTALSKKGLARGDDADCSFFPLDNNSVSTFGGDVGCGDALEDDDEL